MSAARTWLRPWVLVMFGSIAALIAWRLASSPSKTASESSAASAAGASTTETDPRATTMPRADPTTNMQAPAAFPTTDPALDPPAPTATANAAPPKPVALDKGAASPIPEVEPGIDPTTLKARQERSMAFLEKRIAGLEQATRAAQIKGDPAEVQRLQDQTAQAKKRLAILRLETE